MLSPLPSPSCVASPPPARAPPPLNRAGCVHPKERAVIIDKLRASQDKSPRRSSASKEVVAAAKAAATHAHADGGVAIDFTAQVAAMMSQIKQGPTPEEWMAMQLAKDKKQGAAAVSNTGND